MASFHSGSGFLSIASFSLASFSLSAFNTFAEERIDRSVLK